MLRAWARGREFYGRYTRPDLRTQLSRFVRGNRALQENTETLAWLDDYDRVSARALECSLSMTLPEAVALFRRLGVNPASVSRKEFSLAYYRLAKRYHPDTSPRTADLMAQINAARNLICKSFAQN